MIKVETVLRERKEPTTVKLGAEVTIESNNRTELLNELMTLLDAFEKSYPEVLIMAKKLRMEEKKT